MTTRLRHKHSAHVLQPGEHLDGRAVIASQNLRAACYAALVSAMALSIVWLLITWLLGKVFPWFVLIEGIVIGLAVRRWGQGFDWRFVVLAGLTAFLAAYAGGFVIAADSAAAALDTNIANVLLNLSEWTLSLYFAEDVTPADHIFALVSAITAGFYAQRPLSRAEAHAIRVLRDLSKK